MVIALALDELADDDAVPECPKLKLSLVVRKIICFEQVGPEIPGGAFKYMGGGVLAPSGCIYFAPYDVGKVLCIDP